MNFNFQTKQQHWKLQIFVAGNFSELAGRSIDKCLKVAEACGPEGVPAFKKGNCCEFLICMGGHLGGHGSRSAPRCVKAIPGNPRYCLRRGEDCGYRHSQDACCNGLTCQSLAKYANYCKWFFWQLFVVRSKVLYYENHSFIIRTPKVHYKIFKKIWLE